MYFDSFHAISWLRAKSKGTKFPTFLPSGTVNISEDSVLLAPVVSFGSLAVWAAECVDLFCAWLRIVRPKLL